MTLAFPFRVLGAADPVVLVGFIQPLLMLACLAAWAWLVSDKLDKDAQYYHLKRQQWGLVHALVAGGAFVAYLLIPEVAPYSSYWLNVPVFALLLAISPITYILVRNKQVPEEAKITFSAQSFKQSLDQRRARKAIRSAALSFKMADGSTYQTPARDDPAYQVHLGAEEVLLPALERGASNVLLAPAKNGQYVMQMTVDGVPQRLEPPASAPPADVINYVKQLAKLDVADRRRKQRNTIKAIRRTETRPIKVVTDGSAAGMRLSLTLDPEKQVKIKADDLGLLPAQSQTWKSLVSDNHGVVLVAAGAKQGRTSTFYALVEAHDAYLTNVQILELETERPIEGVRHNVFNPTNDDAEFWTTLRAIMRRDPDVVGISELVDAETAQQVASGGLDGPRIYFSLRAENALQAIQAYTRAVGDAEKAAEGLVGAVAVRLVRRLCETCKVPYQPTEAALKKLNLPANKVKQLYKAGGKIIVKGNNMEECPDCHGSGYNGQTGVYEIMQFGEEEREIIQAGDLQRLRAELRKKKTMFIPDAALAKVIEGSTSIDEVNRVLRAPSKAPSRA